MRCRATLLTLSIIASAYSDDPPPSVFYGGANDGHAINDYTTFESNHPYYLAETKRVSGGANDGFATNQYTGFDPDGSYLQAETKRVSGGSSDGFAQYTRHSDYSSTIAPFKGGASDGHSLSRYNGFDLDGSHSLAIQARMSGGSGDGYAIAQTIVFIAPPTYRFAGGSFDGYGHSTSYDVRLKILHPRFLGGSHDGASQTIVYDFPHPTLLDNDKDLMLDLWELMTFGAIETASHRTNADGDPNTDQHEYLHGTDPLNAFSYFAILDYLLKRDRTCSFAFETTPGKKYTLLVSNSLTHSSWTPLTEYENISGTPLRVIEVKATLPYECCFFKVLIEDE